MLILYNRADAASMNTPMAKGCVWNVSRERGHAILTTPFQRLWRCSSHVYSFKIDFTNFEMPSFPRNLNLSKRSHSPFVPHTTQVMLDRSILGETGGFKTVKTEEQPILPAPFPPRTTRPPLLSTSSSSLSPPPDSSPQLSQTAQAATIPPTPIVRGFRL
jgi:hypothetical protein